MKKGSWWLLVVVIGYSGIINAQQALKVLFIGNSYTYYNDLPGTFKKLAASGGQTVTIDSCVSPGAQIFYYPNQSASWVRVARMYAKIRSQKWDFVVLQDNLGAYGNSVGAFPSNLIADNITVRDSVKAANPCCTVVWFAGWGPKAGVKAGDTYSACNGRVEANVLLINNKYANKKEVVAPFGRAWTASMDNNPSINLYYSDNVHPNAAGQLLNASVLFATIFKQNPSGFSYNSTLSLANASYLRGLGYSIVTNTTTYPNFNLSSITPVISFTNGTLSVSGYSSYQWYKENAVISGAVSSTYKPTANGSYIVIATDGKGCKRYQSFPYVVTNVGIGDYVVDKNSVLLYPNPVSDISVIEIKSETWRNSSVEIYDMLGKTILTGVFNTDKFDINRGDLQPGLYFYKVISKQGAEITGKFKVL